MEIQEIDPAALAALPLFSKSSARSQNASDVFADGLTAVAPETLTQAVVASAEGRIAGCAGYRRESPDSPQAGAVLWVDPALRRRGVGTALLGRVERMAAQKGIKSLTCYARRDAGASPFAAARGWREEYREIVQVADAAHVAAFAPGPEDGYAFVPGIACTKAITQEIHAVWQVCLPAMAAFWTVPHLLAALQQARPFNGLAIARRDTHIAGFAWGLDAAPDAVFHEFTGVLPEYRGQGMAAALKAMLAQAALAAGRPRLMTSNRAGNHAIFALNARLGYTPVVELAQYQKEPAPAEETF